MYSFYTFIYLRRSYISEMIREMGMERMAVSKDMEDNIYIVLIITFPYIQYIF